MREFVLNFFLDVCVVFEDPCMVSVEAMFVDVCMVFEDSCMFSVEAMFVDVCMCLKIPV